ncbi:MAG: asparagine synthase (glutamine-hydrolyzing), partial [Bacteroidota bacterium]
MCGINGFISKGQLSKETLAAKIGEMNDIIFHRGPDEDGVYTDVQEGFSLALGMRRLSIIDLSTGKQPIFTDDREMLILFNGEIYNYPILRHELAQEGVTFATHSDTEVILKLYERHGEKAFSKLDGMYGFNIYDKKKGKVVIARDFFGEKPLYYTQQGDKFIWGSELKSLRLLMDERPGISDKGLNHFLRSTYIPAPYTIYDNVFKLEANHCLVYDLKTHSFEISPIEAEFNIADEKHDFATAREKVKDLVRESVESRSISDVPIGTFLSGGVDSSIVSLCLSQMTQERINTFSIGFKKAAYSETDKSRLVAKQINSKHHEFIIGEEDLKHNIHEILLNFDEPFSDTASLPNYLVSKKTSEHVKVALTGDGGDEIFGGYNKYYVGKLNKRYTSVTPKFIHNFVMKRVYPLLMDKDDKRGRKFQIRKMLNSVNYEGNYYWDIISLANSENQLKSLIRPELHIEDLYREYKEKLKIDKPNSLTAYRFIDKIISLEGGMLTKVDRTSMMNSLECRAPFLNKKIWEYTNGLPESYLMKGWDKKYILKEAFRDQFPENFLDISKQGFGSPVGDWLRSGLKKEMESYIEKDFLKEQNIFKLNYLQSIVK